jgi:serine/threonine protein kinase
MRISETHRMRMKEFVEAMKEELQDAMGKMIPSSISYNGRTYIFGDRVRGGALGLNCCAYNKKTKEQFFVRVYPGLNRLASLTTPIDRLIEPKLDCLNEDFLRELTAYQALKPIPQELVLAPTQIFMADAGLSTLMGFTFFPFIPKIKTLATLIQESANGLPIEQVKELALPLLDALDYCHKKGVIHRDIKPTNLVFHEGRLKIHDFGLAYSPQFYQLCKQTKRFEFERSSGPAGTPIYLAPEACINGSRYDNARPSLDIYALGVTLYEMLTRKNPFEDVIKEGTPLDYYAAHASEKPKDIRNYRPDLSAAASAFFQHILEKDPEKRLQNPEHVKRVLNAIR